MCQYNPFPKWMTHWHSFQETRSLVSWMPISGFGRFHSPGNHGLLPPSSCTSVTTGLIRWGIKCTRTLPKELVKNPFRPSQCPVPHGQCFGTREWHKGAQWETDSSSQENWNCRSDPESQQMPAWEEPAESHRSSHSSWRIRADLEKTSALTEMEPPTNISELWCSMGMVNQLGKFSPNLADLTQPLWQLLSTKSTCKLRLYMGQFWENVN